MSYRSGRRLEYVVRDMFRSAVDVDSKESPALEASYGRSSLNALSFLKKALKMCTNKPLVIVDKGPWYRWAFEAWTRV